MPGAERDPLSVRYDRSARRLLLAAISARPRGAAMFVHSPGPQFRELDTGYKFRLTANERAMTRAVYYQVKQEPRHWSAVVDWLRIENRHGRWGRQIRVRLVRYGSGYSHASKRPGSSYVNRPELRSTTGNRVDAGRRAG
jgi:hypothetical protein